MRLMLPVIAFSLLGCTDPVPSIDRDQPYVAVGNGGSLHGSSVTKIYADDTAVYARSGPAADDNVQTERSLPAGTYEKIRFAASEQIKGFNQAEATLACLDYGNDYITIFDASDDLETIGASCPDQNVSTAQNAVLQVYYDAIAEPSA